jgi:hypothetical protein
MPGLCGFCLAVSRAGPNEPDATLRKRSGACSPDMNELITQLKVRCEAEFVRNPGLDQRDPRDFLRLPSDVSSYRVSGRRCRKRTRNPRVFCRAERARLSSPCAESSGSG